jgi:hypothetical protein
VSINRRDSHAETPPSRYDFYQTPSHLILAVYVKGYGVPGLMEHVGVTFQPDSVGSMRSACLDSA